MVGRIDEFGSGDARIALGTNGDPREVSAVEDAMSPTKQDLSTLTTRVEMLENSKELARDTNGPALHRIAVLGIESKDPAVKLATIGDWLRANIPENHFANVENLTGVTRPTGRT